MRRIWPDRAFIDDAEVMRLEDVQVYVSPLCLRVWIAGGYGYGGMGMGLTMAVANLGWVDAGM